MVAPAASPFRIGEFEFHPDAGELRREGRVCRLQPQSSALLLHLARRAGAVVPRDELQASLWSADTFVEFEDGLNHAVARLREAFGDSARNSRYIETLPRRGYRLVAPVVWPPAPPAARPDDPASATPGAPSRLRRLVWPLVAASALCILAIAAWLLAPGGAGAAAARTAPDATAYELYLKGNVQIERYGDHRAAEQALEYYQAAAQRDPRFGAAQAGVAMAYMQKMAYASRPDAHLREAREAARRAVALDPGLAEAHLVLGRLKSHFEWDPKGAEADFGRGVALHPTNTLARNYYSAYLMALERFDESVAFTTDTLALAPHSLSALAMLAEAQVAAGRFAEAEAAANRALAIDPSFSVAHRYLALAFLESDPARAIEESKLVVVPDAANVLALRAAVAACAGRRADALALREQLGQAAATQYVRPTRMAQLETCLGDRDAAFRWLEKGLADHEIDMAQLRMFRLLRPLRSDPRFAEIVRRLNF